MTYEFIGNVIALSEAQQVNTKNGLKDKWTGVIEHENDGTHQPRRVAFTIFDNKNVYDTLNNAIQCNMRAKVTCSIDAKEWQGKWYNDIQCFRAEQVAPQQQMGGYQQQPMQQGYAQPIGQPLPQQQQGYVPPVAPQQQAPQQTAPSQAQQVGTTANTVAGAGVQGQNNGELPF